MASNLPSTSVIGRRLRRYLGALLALGFGTAWWSFVTPAIAAAAAPMLAVHDSPEPMAVRHLVAEAARTAPPPPRPVTRVVVRRRPRPIVKRPLPIDVQPVNDPIAQLTPLVIQMPPVAEPQRVPDPPPEDLPPIITRSS